MVLICDGAFRGVTAHDITVCTALESNSYTLHAGFGSEAIHVHIYLQVHDLHASLS